MPWSPSRSRGARCGSGPGFITHISLHGHRVPILLLDTDLEQNGAADRELTHYLYGGDDTYRLKQEIILGFGGIRLLRALGFEIHAYHMNEGHAALLTLDLLNRWRVAPEDLGPDETLRHRRGARPLRLHDAYPGRGGHDRFSYELFESYCPASSRSDDPEAPRGRRSAEHDPPSAQSCRLCQRRRPPPCRDDGHLFPGYRIHAVTNGVHPDPGASGLRRALHERISAMAARAGDRLCARCSCRRRRLGLPSRRKGEADRIVKSSTRLGLTLDRSRSSPLPGG